MSVPVQCECLNVFSLLNSGVWVSVPVKFGFLGVYFCTIWVSECLFLYIQSGCLSVQFECLALGDG